MRRPVVGLLIGGVSFLTACAHPAKVPASSPAAPVVADARAGADVVTVRDVALRNGVVTGTVVSHSQRTVHEVRLLIRYTWLWKKERKPGRASPGRSAYYTVPDDIPSGSAVRFTYRPTPPLPARHDGHFTATVEVVGFSEVG